MSNNPLPIASNDLLADIRQVLCSAKSTIVKAVNSAVISAYWEVGRYIVEYEQGGSARAEYGKGLLKSLSESLVPEFGNGFNVTNLQFMRLFYIRIPNYDAVRHNLSWTHIRTILKVSDDTAMRYYLRECCDCNWSTRQLERQIHTLYYERLLASRDKAALHAEADKPKAGEIDDPREIIRDPYILDFIGIPQGEHFLENDIEQMLIDKLQHFLLELGKGFTFVARQKRISFDNDHFYIDLVFYSIPARCFVLIDLKSGKLTHQDIGQMQMYVNYYTRTQMYPGDNPSVGIVLCAEKNDTVVRFTLPDANNRIFASQYLTNMPSEEELRQLINESAKDFIN